MTLMRDIEQIPKDGLVSAGGFGSEKVTLTDWYHLAGDLEEFVYFAVDCVDM